MKLDLITVVTSLFVLTGVYMTGYGILVLLRARASTTWPTTPGVILRSEMQSDGDTVSPQIEYQYDVGGHLYRSSEFCFGAGGSTSGGEYAYRWIKMFPKDANVTVRFDPENPKRATLVAGVRKESFIPLCFGVGFAFLGLWAYTLFSLFR
jgi:hypothetical protein